MQRIDTYKSVLEGLIGGNVAAMAYVEERLLHKLGLEGLVGGNATVMAHVEERLANIEKTTGQMAALKISFFIVRHIMDKYLLLKF